MCSMSLCVPKKTMCSMSLCVPKKNDIICKIGALNFVICAIFSIFVFIQHLKRKVTFYETVTTA
jgi:hypothetical protein